MSKRQRSSYYDNHWTAFEKTRPIAVQGGIKAQSRRGAFVANWWADRWIKALARLMDPGRLSRGRSYARRGQVLDIDIKPGVVAARVQGSRRTPYKVSIALQPLSQAQWERVLDALAEQALFAAQLLNGEMPPDIERVFEAVGAPLFPSSEDDLETDCSCPDWANPCKHVAAVYYLLGERFDQDPFLLLELRGKAKEEVIDELRSRRANSPIVAEADPPYAPGQIEPVEAPSVDETLDRYWELGPQIEQLAMHMASPAVEMPLLKRLGAPDFIDARTLWAQMARVYQDVTAQAMEIAYADVDREQSAA